MESKVLEAPSFVDCYPKRSYIDFKSAQFLIVAKFWSSLGGWVIEYTGVWGYKSKLHSLEHFYKCISGKEKYLGQDLFKEMTGKIMSAMDSIRNCGEDTHVDLKVMDYDAGSHGMNVLRYGYWDEVALDIVKFIMDDLKEETERLDVSGTEAKESTNEEADEYLHSIKTQLNMCQELLKSGDIHSHKFIESFIELCDSFNIRKNGYPI